jgi:hypothetical protein
MKTFLEFIESKWKCKNCGVLNSDPNKECEACGGTDFFPPAASVNKPPITSTGNKLQNAMMAHPWYNPTVGKITYPGR